MKRIIVTLSRLLTGSVFVFSGFVKGVDPLGTAYKLEDYFAAYGVSWANDLSLGLSIFLCTVEFAIGVALLLHLKPRFTAWALLLMMAFFTGLTFYDALYAPVPDCGCFGDAIKMTNWQTFYKNVVLMVFTVVVFSARKMPHRNLKKGLQTVILSFFAVLFMFFSIYNYRHLPMIDFRPWKVGNNMLGDPNAETNVYLVYKNKSTGEVKEYLSPNYPWNDSVWLNEWEFIDQRFESTSQAIIHNLKAEDEAGNDFSSYILESEMMFVFVAHDLSAIGSKAERKLKTTSEILHAMSSNQVLITAGLPEELRAFEQQNQLLVEAFYADGVVLKTMIRSNPGLMLLHRGTVMAKWHYNDFPSEKELKELLKSIQNNEN